MFMLGYAGGANWNSIAEQPRQCFGVSFCNLHIGEGSVENVRQQDTLHYASAPQRVDLLHSAGCMRASHCSHCVLHHPVYSPIAIPSPEQRSINPCCQHIRIGREVS